MGCLVQSLAIMDNTIAYPQKTFLSYMIHKVYK
jgi:hypothetical protein